MTEQDMWNIARCVVADAFEKQSILDHDYGRTEQAKRTKQVAKEMRDLIPHGPLGLPAATGHINPDEDFWNSLEQNFRVNYRGGYHEDGAIDIFRHGMATVFNYLRANSVSLFGQVAFSAMREQLEAMESQRDEARKQLAWWQERLNEFSIQQYKDMNK